jgi:hypothetical protein
LKATLVALLLTGSVWAAVEELPFSAEQLRHWAYQPAQKPAVPAVTWVKTPVNAFILAKLVCDEQA